MKQFILLIFISFFAINCFSQCKIDQVLTAKENKNNLTEEILTDFFDQFSKDCKNNVEFSEFSNEILFAVTEANPELVIEVLEKRKEKENFNIILGIYTTPIHDGIDLHLILKKVKEIKAETETKKRIIENIKTAISKSENNL